MPLAPTPLLRSKFDQAMEYPTLLALAEANQMDGPWRQRHAALELTPEQRATVEGFERTMHVLCLTGPWCGDCALQGAAMRRIQEANPERIRLRYLVRDDAHAELVVAARINDGFRVPVTFFLSEDMEVVSAFGDRTLSRYQGMAVKGLPPEEAEALRLPQRIGDRDPVRAVLDECLAEFERIHLLLRLSGRLRKLHGD